MPKKIRNFIFVFLCILIVCYGFLEVSSNLPKFIKEKSAMRINFNPKKADLTIEAGEYVFYFNDKLVNNLLEKTSEAFKNIEKNFINKAN